METRVTTRFTSPPTSKARSTLFKQAPHIQQRTHCHNWSSCSSLGRYLNAACRWNLLLLFLFICRGDARLRHGPLPYILNFGTPHLDTSFMRGFMGSLRSQIPADPQPWGPNTIRAGSGGSRGLACESVRLGGWAPCNAPFELVGDSHHGTGLDDVTEREANIGFSSTWCVCVCVPTHALVCLHTVVCIQMCVHLGVCVCVFVNCSHMSMHVCVLTLLFPTHSSYKHTYIISPFFSLRFGEGLTMT